MGLTIFSRVMRVKRALEGLKQVIEGADIIERITMISGQSVEDRDVPIYIGI